MNTCTYNELENKVVLLVSKKRCIITSNTIALKKGAKKKNAVIKLRGQNIPNKINIKIYHVIFVDKKGAEKIPFYN